MRCMFNILRSSSSRAFRRGSSRGGSFKRASVRFHRFTVCFSRELECFFLFFGGFLLLDVFGCLGGIKLLIYLGEYMKCRT